MNPNKMITLRQAVAYSIVAYHTLKLSGSKDKISYNQLANEIITIMEQNSPQEAVKRAREYLEKERQDL